MKKIRVLTAMMAGSASAAFAASGTQSQDAGLLIYLFIGFFALIVVLQLVPAAILFVGMVKSVMTRTEKIPVD